MHAFHSTAAVAKTDRQTAGVKEGVLSVAQDLDQLVYHTTLSRLALVKNEAALAANEAALEKARCAHKFVELLSLVVQGTAPAKQYTVLDEAVRAWDIQDMRSLCKLFVPTQGVMDVDG
jgi:hypothetical protein